MNSIRTAGGVQSVLLILTLFGSASAEPVLLGEWFRSQSYNQQSALPPTIPFRFTSRYDINFTEFIGGTWTQNIGHADVGQTFDAPQAVVDSLGESLRYMDVRFGGGIGNTNLDIIAPLSGHLQARESYTQYVSALTDYRVTRITRTIDSLILQPGSDSGNHREGGMQTVRLYGERIPEPTSVLLFALSALAIFAMRPTNRCLLRGSRKQ
jgi:hypothetical protein